jgi:sterol desaturase/sphingolipid hydroxylase (fatty acid hydroxylase superfamily)
VGVHVETAIVFVAPVVLAAMVAEARIGRRQGIEVYRWPSVVSDLSCMVASLVGKSVVGVSAAGCYAFVERHLGILDLDARSPAVWVSGFLLMDLMLWCRHWACHRVGLFWALHAVHHQSPDLNIGTANRIPWLQDLQVMPFVFVSAIVGFPAPVFATHLALATAWALWTHTRVVGRLGWLEAVIITPSHHRVHHACNGPYLDRNYGAVLVVWDRLFGTFEPETIEPVYGSPHSTDELCAFRANARPFVELFARARRAPTWLGAFETLWRPPSWDPVSRREELPQLAAAIVEGKAPQGVPYLKLAVLVSCAALALVPLFSNEVPVVGKLAIGAIAFAALGGLSSAASSWRSAADAGHEELLVGSK